MVEHKRGYAIIFMLGTAINTSNMLITRSRTVKVESKVKLDSYWLLLLQLPAWVCFIVLVTWYECIPVERAGEYIESYPSIINDIEKTSATCFFIDHGKYWFLKYPDIKENKIFLFLILLLLVIMQALTIKPFLRFRDRSRNRKLS